MTTRSQVSVYRTNDPMKTIAAIDLQHDQDGRYTHIWKKKEKKMSSDCTCAIVALRWVKLAEVA